MNPSNEAFGAKRADANGRQIGYCTNVHAGVELHSIRENLTQYATVVRDSLSESHGQTELGVGLWIPDRASQELTEGSLNPAAETLAEFKAFLARNRLLGFTINGFPFANFHGDEVKQRVYLPTWASVDRLAYTQRLAVILAGLLPDNQPFGSISTLPIGWPSNPFGSGETEGDQWSTAGENFRRLALFLQRIHRETGKHIVVAIEPEPGCMLDCIDDMLRFFDTELSDPIHRKYITACHDICHSAVMNEPQREVVQRYSDAGITIGKVQVSSAIVADWKTIPTDRWSDALDQLREFAEDRYLHQTGQLRSDGGFELATDLPELLSRVTPDVLSEMDRWVIHFHVPIFLEAFGHLTTSRDAVVDCLNALSDPTINVDFTGHLEVETYAWTVLPESMRQRGLAQDIASELAWLLGQLQA